MIYKDAKGNPTGKYGRADLFLGTNNGSYIWEVKPYSYSTEPNKSAGELQLGGYVETDSTYHIGDSRISGGQVIRTYIVMHEGENEVVKYEIPYTVESN